MTDTAAPKRLDKKYSRYYTYIEPIVSDPVIAGYFTLVATLLLTAFFIFFALSPTFSTIVGLVRKIEDQKKLIAAMDTKINSLIIAQENYTQVEQFLPLLDSAIPQRPLPETLITDTLRISSSSGIVNNSFRIASVDLLGSDLADSSGVAQDSSAVKSDVIKSLGIPLVEFKMSISGSESEIRQFALKLQNLPRIISLATLSVSNVDPGTIGADSNGFTAEISAAAYYQNKKNQPAVISPILE